MKAVLKLLIIFGLLAILATPVYLFVIAANVNGLPHWMYVWNIVLGIALVVDIVILLLATIAAKEDMI